MNAKNKKSRIKKIKDILWYNDLDVAKLARMIGRSRTWTSQVLYGHVKSEPTRQAIADALNLIVGDIWPKNNKKAA